MYQTINGRKCRLNQYGQWVDMLTGEVVCFQMLPYSDGEGLASGVVKLMLDGTGDREYDLLFNGELDMYDEVLA